MKTLQSWGRYPEAPQWPHPVHWQDTISRVWLEALKHGNGTLAFGNGRSYGDSCLAASGHVVHMRALDRFISADWQAGVLRAEPGVTLEQVLGLTLPRGWMLPVTPGTKFATLGGAVANDVHGKNHHLRGTFGMHVRRFALQRSDGSMLECSPVLNAEMFAATIGGLGLTGLICWVEIQLMPIRSSMIDVTSIRFSNLDEFFSLSEELDAFHEYSVAWVDCHSRGKSLGRGIFMVGDHANDGPLETNRRPKHRVPFTLPIPLFNRVTLWAGNELYYRWQWGKRVKSRVSYDAYFYPLDSVLGWNRIYGPSGFQQHQCVVPANVARDAIRAILGEIAASGTGSFLAVLKRCGASVSPGMLSFPMEGTSLALDFPQRDDVNSRLFARMDAIVREAGGRIYPAKDAHMSGAHFRHFYPSWRRIEELRDPALMSRFWERVTRT